MEEAALNLPQERTPVILTRHRKGSHHAHPVTLEAVVEARTVGVEGARNSEGSLVDQVGQADQEGLEAGTRTQAVTRGTAQPQFTEVGMSWVQDSHSAN